MARGRGQKTNGHPLSRHDGDGKSSYGSEETEEGGTGLSLLQKLMLNASLWGNEASCDFEQLYTVPILQTLGLPLRLATLTGVVSGPTATLLLPFLGWWSDRGSNPNRRKTVATILVCVLTSLGMLCVIMANVLHLNKLVDHFNANNRTAHDSFNELTTQDPYPFNFSVLPGKVLSDNASSGVWGGGGGGESTMEYRRDGYGVLVGDADWGLEGVLTDAAPLFSTTEVVAVDEESSEVPFKAVLAMVGFIIMDVGFDAYNACVKSFLLTCCPRSEHTSLLVIGLVMASSGGVSTAALGLVDFSSLLGMNYLEGAKLTIQTTIQAMVIIVFMMVGLPITLLNVSRLLKLRQSSSEDACIPEPSDSQHPPVIDEVCLHHEEQFPRSVILDAFENSIRSLGGGGVHFDQSIALLDERQRSLTHSFDHHSHHHPNHHASTEHTPLLASQKPWKESGAEEELERSRPISISVSYKKRDSLTSIPEHLEAGETALVKLQENQLAENCKGDELEMDVAEAERCHWEWGFKTKLFLVILAASFSASDLSMFTMTSSDFVGKAIFGGDPAAPPGSQRLKDYQDGVTMSSVGFFIYYISFLAFSFIQTRVLPRIGYRVEFTAVHVVVSAAFIALSLTEMLEVYFVLTVVAGVHRACIYSVPFAVINDIMQSRAQEKDGAKANVGLAISLVTASFALQYCLLFSWIGPLEELTGVVAVPFYVGAVSALLAACSFLALGKV